MSIILNGIDYALTIDGWMDQEDLEWLAEQAQSHSNIAEVGCWKGRTTCVLAANTSGRVWAIDTWEGPHDIHKHAGEYPEIVAGVDVYQQFIINLADYIRHKQVRVMRMSSLEAVWVFGIADRKFDMVFIDADHEYDYVKSDIVAWRTLVEPGGLLCGHDFGIYPDVSKAVMELLPNYSFRGAIWYATIGGE